MENNILTAEQAFRDTGVLYDHEEMDHVMDLIRKAIYDDRYSVVLDVRPKPSTIKKLHEWKYKTDSGSQYNQGYFTVSWDMRKDDKY